MSSYGLGGHGQTGLHIAHKYRARYLLIAAGVLLAVAGARSVAATTMVQVGICGPDDPVADMHIVAPSTGTTVHTLPLVVSGRAHHVSQVNVRIDGQPDGAVAIPSGHTSFRYDAHLQPGTHTVTLEGNDATCRPDVLEAVITVAYEPPVTPPVAAQTRPGQPSAFAAPKPPVAPTTPSPARVTQDQPLASSPQPDDEPRPATSSFVETLLAPLDALGEQLGVLKSAPDTALGAPERLSLLGIGTTLLAGAPLTENLAMSGLQLMQRPQTSLRVRRISKTQQRLRTRHHHQRLLAFRVAGALSIGIVFLV